MQSQGLNMLGAALRSAPKLEGYGVTFTHLLGKNTSRSALVGAGARGMSGNDQNLVLESFREPGGRKV